MVTALHIKADGTREFFEYDEREALDELQRRVGGYIELAPVGDQSLTMYCNEEGKIQGFPINTEATLLLDPRARDIIVGDAVLVGAADEEGYDTSLPAAYAVR